MDLVDAVLRRGGVLGHLDEAYEVEGPIAEWQRFRPRDDHVKAAGAHPLRTPEADLNSDDERRWRQMAHEEVDVASVARAQVQHAARCGARFGQQTLLDEFWQHLVDRKRFGVRLERRGAGSAGDAPHPARLLA